jgi:hypothetical protein
MFFLLLRNTFLVIHSLILPLHFAIYVNISQLSMWYISRFLQTAASQLSVPSITSLSLIMFYSSLSIASLHLLLLSLLDSQDTPHSISYHLPAFDEAIATWHFGAF